MSGSKEKTPLVRLVASGHNPATEILVIDGRFGIAASGFGSIEVALAPGLYTVRFQAGSTIREAYAALEPGIGVVRVDAPELPFASPIPLQGTRTTRADHERHAEEQSRLIHRRHGSGGLLFVFIRALEGWERGSVANGLTLHDLAGTPLIDFSRDGVRSLDHQQEAQWAACTAELDPGTYRLRAQYAESEALEQIVIVSQGWQTQVFLLRSGYDPGSIPDRPELLDTAIIMARAGTGFDAARPEFSQTELLRQGLAERRILPAVDLAVMAWVDQENPMLGIYGAHLLLSAARPNPDLLQRVAAALRHLVGAHPDVLALDIALGLAQASPPIFQAPPMLRSSWDIVVGVSARLPAIVPPGSLSARAAARLWQGGMWVVWQVPEPSTQPAPAAVLDLTALRNRLPWIIGRLPGSRSIESIEQIAVAERLNALERYLLAYVADVLLPPKQARIGAAPPDGSSAGQLHAVEADLLSDAALVQHFGVPIAALCEAASGLIHKLAPVDIPRLVDATLRHLSRLAQLEALDLLPNTPAVAALRRLMAEAGVQATDRFPTIETPAERAALAAQLARRLEQDEQLAITLDALLQDPALQLSSLQRIAALVPPLARATYAQLGRAPGALRNVLRKYFQAEQVQKDPWLATVPAGRWWAPRIGAIEGRPDPDVQHVGLIHAALVELLKLDQQARRAALDDPDKHALHEQARRVGRRARLSRQREQAFVEAYIAAIQALGPALEADLLDQ